MSTSDTSSPNVVVIYTDDQDPDRVGCYGGEMPTPNIDRLAEEGMRFTNYYASSAVCAPSRFSALTGRYASRNDRLQEVSLPDGPVKITNDAGICGDPHTLPGELSDRGYVTGMVGKWHQGLAESPKDDGDVMTEVSPESDPREPDVAETMSENYSAVREVVRECGFDEARSVYHTNPKNEINVPAEMYHHNMDWVTQGAVEFLEANATGEDLFFLYVAPTLTHGPWGFAELESDPTSTPAGYLESPPDVQPSRESVAERAREAGLINGRRGDGFEVGANVVWLDDGVGAILNKLDELGVADETVVIFTSDHGDIMGKGTCYDGGVRQPFLVRWPGRVEPGSTCDALVSNIDIAPTLFDAVGAALPADYEVDGRSLLPLLSGESSDWRQSLYLEVLLDRGVVTRDGFKYITRLKPADGTTVSPGDRYSGRGEVMSPFGSGPWNADVHYPDYFDREQLYDLDRDPGEQHNVARDPEYADTIADLRETLREYCADLPGNDADL